MRPLSSAVAAILLLPAALAAQGEILPCRLDRCPPVIGAGQVVRTSSDIRVSLDGRVLSYEVDETFTNRGGMLGEADYVFPLPKGAAFQDLQLSINGELVSGETMDADEARRIYEEIVRRKRDPALVEWMGHGLLRTRIFPIAPGERKRVVVRFQMVAEREGDALRVDYFRGGRTAAPGPVPMPRPIPRISPPDDASRERWRPMRDDDERSSFTLTYPAGGELGRAYSPTHALDVEERGGRRRVTVRGDAREVAILIPVRRRSEAAITLLTHAPSRGDDGFALITLAPPAAAPRTVSRDVTFVLDVSGSMRGRKLEQARDAGRELLATLGPRDRFRIIDFSTDVRSFRDGFVPATRANIAAAERYLDDLRAEGSTNIEGALEEALASPAGAGRLPLVLFMTDGEPTVGVRGAEALAELAARERGDARLFTFGLGADVNVALLERLALDGRGTAHFVRPEESPERAVQVVASRLTSPVATGLRVRVDGDVRLVKMHPAGGMDLFAGQDLVVLARYQGSGRARLRVEGESANGPVRWTTDVSFPERQRDNAFIPRLWATQRIGWLSAERRRGGPTRELDAEIRELGERYGIPTELTSYFVREPGMDVADMARREPRRGGVQLNEVVVTGAAAAPAAAPAAKAQAFDAAREAAAQRAVTSLAAVD
ncbi:MAG TPA: VIT domain-containing protein, partial [Gemmatimonadaceae bacterium]|nr:VIT domain-containing protein [Gemmatimonadaceae bacterium]